MDVRELIKNLLGRIKLTKPTMFGLDSNDIVLIVSPSLKIFEVVSRPKKLVDTFPFQKDRELDTVALAQWAEENGYTITFQSRVPSLTRKLYQNFGDVMVESVSRKPKEVKLVVLEELEKSGLPDSIKEWAKNNPEKFIENIQTIQEMLKK